MSHPRAALLLCWPPCEDREGEETAGDADDDAATLAARAERRRCERMGADALAAFRGDTVLYVGEFDGAAATGAELTGGARLHGALRAGWHLARAPLPLGERWRTHWYGFDEAQDWLTIWHRRGLGWLQRRSPPL
jgi:hypothetical protein